MTEETRNMLNDFDVEMLRLELLVRGSSMHARVASSTIALKKDLGGNFELAHISSQDIFFALMEKQKGIYGVDDRLDLFQVTDPDILKNANSVVSLFKSGRIKNNNDETSTLQVGKFGQINSLCQDEPFFNQPVGAFCTGFLVAPDVIATAGHCVNESNVTSIRFVFGFKMLNANDAQVIINNNDIFSGMKVIGRKLTEADADWCLVRLDRPALNRKILKIRTNGKIANNQDVYVIGHPSGLTMKFANGANVRTNTESAFFTANLDTYGGNSGSPVFNAADHIVEGVLVRGATDFVPLGNCMVSAVCPTNGCGGEDCTRVSEFINHIP